MGPTALTVPTDSGRRRSARTLILTVTRRCDLRCAYCPTAKDGHPELDEDQATSAVELFATRYGGGDVKVFGGEPLLVPEVVRAVVAKASRTPNVRRVYVSTNGLGLDQDWLDWVANEPKAILTISMDGAPADHRRYRKALPGAGDAYEHLIGLLPALRSTPRVVITQTIPPASASRFTANFEHLRSLGLTRFNLLPGYFLPWRQDQLADLRRGFDAVAEHVRSTWESGGYLYLRNLFTWAPTPFFNTGLVVDSDGSVHASNMVLSGKLEELGAKTRLGTLQSPPSAAQLDAGAERTWALLQEALPERIIESTMAADGELSRFVRGLYPSWARWKRSRDTAPEVRA
jgi:hypothetical protein